MANILNVPLAIKHYKPYKNYMKTISKNILSFVSMFHPFPAPLLKADTSNLSSWQQVQHTFIDGVKRCPYKWPKINGFPWGLTKTYL